MIEKFELDHLMCDEVKQLLRDNYYLLVRVSIYDSCDHLLRQFDIKFAITNMYGALIEYIRNVRINYRRSTKCLVELQLISSDIFSSRLIMSDVC